MTVFAGPPSGITAADIISVVSEQAAVSVQDLVGDTRTRAVVSARQEAMYLCRELTDLSAAEIGSVFGHRDETVALYAAQKIRALMVERLEVRDRILNMTARIKLQRSESALPWR